MKIPTCNKCGQDHYNVHPCPPARKPVDYLRTQPAPDGFRFSTGWGVNTRSVPIIYTLKPRPSHGSVTMADGTPYQPPAA